MLSQIPFKHMLKRGCKNYKKITTNYLIINTKFLSLPSLSGEKYVLNEALLLRWTQTN
jgi:hypothetical protein